jgi:hypothetical protein
MFQFPAFAHLAVRPPSRTAGFPHSEILGSMRVCRSPKLIAAYRVLHRLRVPRHPLRAFCRLTTESVKQNTRVIRTSGDRLFRDAPATLWFGFASLRDHYPLLLSIST